MNAQARLGAFVIIALVFLALFSSRIGHFQWIQEQGQSIETTLDDASGIAVQSAVLMAGVKVGKITGIILQNNQAHIQMLISPSIALPASTQAQVAGGGLVGEKYIALTATPGDTQPLEQKHIPAKPQVSLDSLLNHAASITEGINLLSKKANEIADSVNHVIEENRSGLKQATQGFGQAGQEVSHLLKQHQKDMNQLLSTLPKVAKSGEIFFQTSSLAMQDFHELIIDNRENLYRTLFELRQASENLAAFSDNLRRNPWKLLKEKPEVKASHRAKQAKIEEMLLTTGKSGQ